MTQNKTFKRRVRERMSKTGESYTAARKQVGTKKAHNAAARGRLAAEGAPVSDASVERSTGKPWSEWYAILDAWDGTTKTHGDIARYVGERYGVSGWWSQAVAVGYERARGMRLKHQKSDGFSITASKTVSVPLNALFEAFVDDAARKKWLSDVSLSLRTAQPGRSARFDYEGGATRLNVGFVDKGPAKSMVAIEHTRLPDAGEAETMKAWWKARLGELKSHLEASGAAFGSVDHRHRDRDARIDHRGHAR